MKPKIRLKGHIGEWKEYPFNEIFHERHELSTITESLPQLSFTIAEGVIEPENRKTNKRDFLIKDIVTKKYLITRYNDIIYNPANVILEQFIAISFMMVLCRLYTKYSRRHKVQVLWKI